MNTIRTILGKNVDIDEVMSEANAISDNSPSVELVLAISLRKIAEKFELELKDLKDQLFIKQPTLQELEDEGKLFGVPKPIDLQSHRAMKQADINLSEIIDAMNNMTDDKRPDLSTQHRLERAKPAQEDPTITLGDELDSRDIYLFKNNPDPHGQKYIVGLHAVGHAGPYEYDLVHQDGKVERKQSNFMAIETWGNEYDDQHNMLGRGSFRLHTSDIEEYAKQLEVEGWERYEGPKGIK